MLTSQEGIYINWGPSCFLLFITQYLVVSVAWVSLPWQSLQPTFVYYTKCSFPSILITAAAFASIASAITTPDTPAGSLFPGITSLRCQCPSRLGVADSELTGTLQVCDILRVGGLTSSLEDGVPAGLPTKRGLGLDLNRILQDLGLRGAAPANTPAGLPTKCLPVTFSKLTLTVLGSSLSKSVRYHISIFFWVFKLDDARSRWWCRPLSSHWPSQGCPRRFEKIVVAAELTLNGAACTLVVVELQVAGVSKLLLVPLFVRIFVCSLWLYPQHCALACYQSCIARPVKCQFPWCSPGSLRRNWVCYSAHSAYMLLFIMIYGVYCSHLWTPRGWAQVRPCCRTQSWTLKPPSLLNHSLTSATITISVKSWFSLAS